MKTNKKKELCIDILVDIAAGVLIALGTYNFATAAKFPMSGFNGIGLIFYHLWGLLQTARQALHAALHSQYFDYITNHGLCRAAVSVIYGRKDSRHGLHGGAVRSWLRDDFYAGLFYRRYGLHLAEH